MIVPESCDRRDLEHADDARLAVDLDVRRVRDQLRREERLHAEPADAAAPRRRGGPRGTLARALAEQLAACAPASSAIDTDRSGLPLTRTAAVGQLEVVAVRLELLGGQVEQLLADLVGGATTARPLLNVVCEPDAPTSHGPASVSW